MKMEYIGIEGGRMKFRVEFEHVVPDLAGIFPKLTQPGHEDDLPRCVWARGGRVSPGFAINLHGCPGGGPIGGEMLKAALKPVPMMPTRTGLLR